MVFFLTYFIITAPTYYKQNIADTSLVHFNRSKSLLVGEMQKPALRVQAVFPKSITQKLFFYCEWLPTVCIVSECLAYELFSLCHISASYSFTDLNVPDTTKCNELHFWRTMYGSVESRKEHNVDGVLHPQILMHIGKSLQWDITPNW